MRKKNISKLLDKEGYYEAFYYIAQVMRTNGEKATSLSHEATTGLWGRKVLDQIRDFVCRKYNIPFDDVWNVTEWYENQLRIEHDRAYNAINYRICNNKRIRYA